MVILQHLRSRSCVKLRPGLHILWISLYLRSAPSRTSTAPCPVIQKARMKRLYDARSDTLGIEVSQLSA